MVLVSVLLFGLGCDGVGLDVKFDPPVPTDGVVTTSEPTTTPTLPTAETTPPPTSGKGDPEDLAAGLTLTRVTLNQSVQTTLYDAAGVEQNLAPPVAGRDGLLRLFVELDSGFQSRAIDAVLTIEQEDGTTEILTVTETVDTDSIDSTLDSTLNFELTAEQLLASTELYVELREGAATGPGNGDVASTSWDSAVAPDGLDLANSGDITIVIVPVRYNADGSGRLPDTGQSAMDELQERVAALYPTTDVVIRVDPPFEWANVVDGNSGWGELLDAIAEMRLGASEAPATFYYGLFMPADTFSQFCGLGCTTGISYVGTSPDYDYLKSSIGVGFNEYDIATSTLLHEVGHALGRFHAPCGVGTQEYFPHNDARLGRWGYDRNNGELLDPADYRDIMSYCSPNWISDYNYEQLRDRLEYYASAPLLQTVDRTRLTLGARGKTGVAGTVSVAGVVAGERIEVQLFNALGDPAGVVMGSLFPYSHAVGGSVLLDQVLAPGWTAQVL